MANFKKTVDENGQEFTEINDKFFPSRTLKPGESLKNPKRFNELMRRVRNDYHAKANASLIRHGDKVLR